MSRVSAADTCMVWGCDGHLDEFGCQRPPFGARGFPSPSVSVLQTRAFHEDVRLPHRDGLAVLAHLLRSDGIACSTEFRTTWKDRTRGPGRRADLVVHEAGHYCPRRLTHVVEWKREPLVRSALSAALHQVTRYVVDIYCDRGVTAQPVLCYPGAERRKVDGVLVTSPSGLRWALYLQRRRHIEEVAA